MPGIALAQAWRRRAPEHESFYATGPRPIDARLLGKTDIPFVQGARAAFNRFRPDAVAVTGGRSSVDAAWEAFRRGVPFFVLEQNVVPGRANRLLSLASRRVFSQFGEARRWFRGAFVHSGSPMRDLRRVPRAEALDALGLDSDRMTVLVLGGSLGSECLNRLGPAVADILGEAFQWIHLSGNGRSVPVYRRRARVLPFVDDMGLVYSAADCVISRAGATAIQEIAACGLPAILVPFPGAADDHQTANARVLWSAGAAEYIDEADLEPRDVARRLATWNATALGRAVTRFARPEAGNRIAEEIASS